MPEQIKYNLNLLPEHTGGCYCRPCQDDRAAFRALADTVCQTDPENECGECVTCKARQRILKSF